MLNLYKLMPGQAKKFKWHFYAVKNFHVMYVSYDELFRKKKT